MDPRVELYKAAFSQRGGAGGEYIPKFYGTYRYQQHGGGLGDMFRSIWRWVKPVAQKGFEALLRSGGESMSQGSTWKEALKSSLKPTLGAVLTATADQVAIKPPPEAPAAAPPPGPPIAHPESVLVGMQGGRGQRGGRRARPAYKKSKPKRAKVMSSSFSRHPIIYNF